MYAGDQGRWVDIPVPMLRAYADRADMIAAERALVMMSAVQAGTPGGMKKHERAELIASWKRAADRGRRRVGGLVAQLMGIGIPIIKEPRDGG